MLLGCELRRALLGGVVCAGALAGLLAVKLGLCLPRLLAFLNTDPLPILNRAPTRPDKRCLLRLPRRSSSLRSTGARRPADRERHTKSPRHEHQNRPDENRPPAHCSAALYAC